MNIKLISVILTVVLLTVFTTVVYAKNSNFLCSKKNDIIVTLKNDANIDISKEKISKIPQIKIIHIQYRDKEWSKMVNKMDLPKMDNPFKNEFTVRTKRNANINEIFNKIKGMDFVENVKYASEKE